VQITLCESHADVTLLAAASQRNPFGYRNNNNKKMTTAATATANTSSLSPQRPAHTAQEHARALEIVYGKHRAVSELSTEELRAAYVGLWRGTLDEFVRRFNGGDPNHFAQWLARKPLHFKKGCAATDAVCSFVEQLRLSAPVLTEAEQRQAKQLLATRSRGVETFTPEELWLVFCHTWPPRPLREFAQHTGRSMSELCLWVRGDKRHRTSTCAITRWMRHYARSVRDNPRARDRHIPDAEPPAQIVTREMENSTTIMLTDDRKSETDFTIAELATVFTVTWLRCGGSLKSWALAYVIELLDVLDWFAAAVNGLPVPDAARGITEWMRQYIVDIRNRTVPVARTPLKQEPSPIPLQTLPTLSSSSAVGTPRTATCDTDTPSKPKLQVPAMVSRRKQSPTLPPPPPQSRMALSRSADSVVPARDRIGGSSAVPAAPFGGML